MTIIPLLNNINRYILNPIIILLFGIALLVFFWGIFEFVGSETADAKREAGKKKILWGLFGMFIMISAKALINLILATFGLSGPPYLGL